MQSDLKILQTALDSLSAAMKGMLESSHLHRALYATDASIYRKTPLAVAFPKNSNDIKLLLAFANKHQIGLIPRAAGTSLAGQCVGDGIVVDTSKHLNRILEINETQQTVKVQPGVVRDELNAVLKPFGLFFAPETATSNRCTLGGMAANNSSGTTSLKYGVTRDKVIAMKTLLGDGSEVVFEAVSKPQWNVKCGLQTNEGAIYRKINELLRQKEIQKEIHRRYPKKQIHRRNNGYALDALIKMDAFTKNGADTNLCSLLCGSEGTLAFTTALTLKLDPLPPKHRVMVVPHFNSVLDACRMVKHVLAHDLYTCEMIDKTILDCTRYNKIQKANRFFLADDPACILMLELKAKSKTDLEKQKQQLLHTLEKQKLAYAVPSLYGNDIEKVLELRRAGLGLLGNLKGDKKAVACIEDTAVAADDLADYISDFEKLMQKHGQKVVYYAHAGAGELHLRPMLDLKNPNDVDQLKIITEEVAELVKKYNGSLSGEHGDGIVRSSYIKKMLGTTILGCFVEIKSVFDPQFILNPGKIVNPWPLDKNLRSKKSTKRSFNSFLNFKDKGGILGVAEQCNGSGDCRKSHAAAGVMCPSFQATKNEKDSTRARANALREFLTTSGLENGISAGETHKVLDLCLSCKACASECPSSVDMAVLKAEFLHHYHKKNGNRKLSDYAYGFNPVLNKIGVQLSGLSNRLLQSRSTAQFFKRILNMHPDREFPVFKRQNYAHYLKKFKNMPEANGKAILFLDEFTRYLEPQIILDAIFLLRHLSFGVILYKGNSGRSLISFGFLKQFKRKAERNIKNLTKKKLQNLPVLGLEPSTILGFKDEYLRLGSNKQQSQQLASRCFLIETFLLEAHRKGLFDAELFTSKKKQILWHAHCHQKALADANSSLNFMQIPENFEVKPIKAGCCGMAGSFGYQKPKYEISQQIAELQLFPEIRKAHRNELIAANGNSCRQQIKDGLKINALHPVTVIKNALKKTGGD